MLRWNVIYVRKENSFTFSFVCIPCNCVCLGAVTRDRCWSVSLLMWLFLLLLVRSLSRIVMDFIHEIKWIIDTAWKCTVSIFLRTHVRVVSVHLNEKCIYFYYSLSSLLLNPYGLAFPRSCTLFPGSWVTAGSCSIVSYNSYYIFWHFFMASLFPFVCFFQ